MSHSFVIILDPTMELRKEITIKIYICVCVCVCVCVRACVCVL